MKSFLDANGIEWFLAAELSLHDDLTPVVGFLSQNGLIHRVTEERDMQLIWVTQVETVEPLAAFIERWRNGELNIVQNTAEVSPEKKVDVTKLLLTFMHFPVTSLLLMGGLFGFFAVEFAEQYPFYSWLRFINIGNYWLSPDNQFSVPIAEPWRFWTPMFIHFGVFHILGNALFIWFLGIRLEKLLGSVHYLWLVLLLGAGSNIGQFAWEHNPNFGGLSGVNYGLMGYILVRQNLAPHPLLNMPTGILYVSLLMLVLGVFGVVDIFLDGSVANAAHVSGLLLGLSVGFVSALNQKSRPKNDV